MKEVMHCVICGNNDHDILYEVPDRHYGVRGYFSFSKCNHCGLIFMNPMIENDELFELYPPDYYDTDVVDASALMEQLDKGSNKLRNFFIDSSPRDLKRAFSDKTILDLGVGNCEQLYLLSKSGAKAYGTEIRDSACEIGEKMGLKISKGTLLEADYPDSFFDYVRSNHSFEHITNPIETLKEFNRIIKVGGELFIGVPNTNSWTFKLFKDKWYYLGAPFHPFSYNVQNLIQFAEQYGFKAVKVIHNGSWVGMIGGISILLNLKNGKKSNEGWFWNKFNKLFFHQIARISNLFKQGDCMEILFVKEKSI